MSLLLDALKKTGSAQQTGADGQQPAPGSLSEMTLQELPGKPATSSPAPAGSRSNSSPRSSGENLFAAKAAPARKKFQYNLGIIPTAIILGLVLGVAGGIYVWFEIQPPKTAEYPGSSTAVVANTAPPPRAATSHPAPPLALPPASLAETATTARPARPAPQSDSRVSSAYTKRTPSTQPDTDIKVKTKLEDDGIYSALMAGYQAYRIGDLGTAWQRYREVLQRDAKNRDALLGMAAIAQQQGQDDTAMQYYKQVLLLDPRDPLAHAGMSAITASDAAGKESHLKLNLAQSPQSAALHFALGNLYSEQSRWGEAQNTYFNALRLEPGNAQFAFNLATSLDHMGQVKLAAQYYGQALQFDTSGNSGFDRVQTQQRLNQLLAPAGNGK